ncbi:MAG: hypothetical protein KIT10_02650 [Flavobacteriales bacterium]|nr:hypothetical protein [Flavobacteriales bacterium]
MKILLPIALSLWLGATPLMSQSKTDRASVKWGVEMNDSKDGAFEEVVGYTDDHVYMTVSVKKEVFLRKMDSKHRTVYQKLIPLTFDRNDHTLKEVVLFGDKLLVFTTFLDKKDKSTSVYLRTFSEADMKPLGRIRKLSTIDVASRRNTGASQVRVSPGDKAVLVSQLLPFDKDGSERFELKVFDTEMNPIWERSVELPYADKEFTVENVRVADDGSVLMIGMKYAEKREAKELKKDGKATYEYHLLVFHGDGSPVEDHPITVPDKFFQDLSLNIGTDGDILCGGFYGSKGSFAISGTFFLRLDRESMAIIHSSFKEFEKDFITSYMTEKEEAKATKKAEKKGEELELPNYELRDIIRRDDGGVVMVAEQYRYYVTTVTTTDANGRTTMRYVDNYVYNDIIVVNVDPNGDIVWAAKVPKRQHSVNDGGRYSSYALVVKDDHIYVMFNDSGKNLMLLPGDKVEPFKYGKDMLITLATINADGKVFREALLPQDKRDAITRPKAGVQTGDDRLFIYANWKKTHRFGTVTFN